MIAPAKPADVVLRIERNHHYKTISTLASEDERLSWKAKGLHTYLVTRPDSWSFNCADLIARSTDGPDSVKSGLKELKQFGYLIIAPQKGAGGRLVGWQWTVFESAPDVAPSVPACHPATESGVFRQTEGPPRRKVDFPSDGNDPHLTKNRITSNTQVRIIGPRNEYPPEFDEAWQATPYRAGNNPKQAAFKAWSARLKEGVPSADLLAGAQRYAHFCDSTNLTGTQHVMMGSTFFGPNRPYEQDWDCPSGALRL